MSKKQSDLKDSDVQEVTEETIADTVSETVDKTVPEPPHEKKKESNLPEWMLDKTTVNELKFCKYFVETHPLKCIKGLRYENYKRYGA